MDAVRDHGLVKAWPAIEGELASQMENNGDRRNLEAFKEKILAAQSRTGKDYIAAIKALSGEDAGQGTAWLQGIVDKALDATLKMVK
jgi:hypothetical protein